MYLPNPLIHYSSQITLLPTEKEPTLYSPPKGFWVSVGTAWLDFQKNAAKHSTGSIPYPRKFKYAHEIILDPNAQILLISNEADFDAFNNTYKAPHDKIQAAGIKVTSQDHMIDWYLVKQEYQGIIISPHLDNRAFIGRGNPINTSYWYNRWCVASGCIWDVRIIKEIKTNPVAF